jgi:hypothetical protein
MTKRLDHAKVLEELNNIKYANEYRSKSVKGVKGLSFADMDTIILYVEDHQKYQGQALHGRLMEPRGKIKEVLDRYGIKYDKEDPFCRRW